MTEKQPQTLLHMPRALHERAEAEAARRRKQTGAPATWQQVIREILTAHLPPAK